VTLYRRHTGGRALPNGDGFIGVSLILPHRSSLFSDEPFALAPYQVLNRYVRGFMEACRVNKLRVNYPGRDLVTIDRRIVAAVSFDTDERGTLLFEAVIANTREFSILPDLLETADRDGVVKAELMPVSETTCLSREVGRDLTFAEVAEMVRHGYERQFEVEVLPQKLNALEQQAIAVLATREFRSDNWLHGRKRPPELDRCVSTWAQLGVFEVFFALEQERFIKEVLFAGDFIANHAAVSALERGLRLCPIDWRTLNDVVTSVFEAPENYLLGVGKLRVVADLLVRGDPQAQ